MKFQAKSCAAIHDLSGVGKCSLTVAIPVLSVCGVETSVLPTAVLSTHTGGFEDVLCKDLTGEMLPIARRWRKEGCRFSSLYSGFLGSAEQIGIVEEIFRMFREPDTLVMVDPVMGDNGKLYRTYTEEMADGMVRLCRAADLVAPNLTEACRILKTPYDPGPYTEEMLRDMLRRLCDLGPSMAVLTGVSCNETELGAACYNASSDTMELFVKERVEGVYHGTGDLFSSCLLGGLLSGLRLGEACEIAVEFTYRSILSTRDSGRELRFGPAFEGHLPWLGTEMERRRREKTGEEKLLS